MHGVTEEQEAEHKAWVDAHYPAKCDCGHAMILAATTHGCESWYCTRCHGCKIRDIPREVWTEPAWSIGANFADHITNTERIRPIEPASTLRKCARCGQVFTAKPDGFVDEALENEIAAHLQRCFVVGDWVRGEWNHGWPISFEGEVLAKPAMFDAKLVISVRIARSADFIEGAECRFALDHGDIRRIPRPVQQPTVGPAPREPEPKPDEDENLWREIEKYTLGPRDFWPSRQGGVLIAGPGVTVGTVTVSIVESAPVPTPLFDGITSVACLNRWRDNRSCIEHGGTPLYDMTPAQITEGKRMFTGTWSAKLRAKLAASAAAERLTVLVDQDPDDIPWR